MTREFTGRKMLAVMVGSFAIIIAVNFTMASYATASFSGVVVENSYVASQKFNGWLEQAEQQQALGWSAHVLRQGDRLVVRTQAVPADASVEAVLRRPIGQRETRGLTFAPGEAKGTLVSLQEVPAGRWLARLTITSGDDVWRAEEHIN